MMIASIFLEYEEQLRTGIYIFSCLEKIFKIILKIISASFLKIVASTIDFLHDFFFAISFSNVTRKD